MDIWYFYAGCAIFGGAVLVIQFLLLLFGLDGDSDSDITADQDVHTGHTFGLLSIRALSSAFTILGLAGLAAQSAGFDPILGFAIALAAGIASMYSVAFIMRSFAQLKADNTIRIERTIGKPATVYLKIPAHRAGTGKVTVVVQNRSVEFSAVTAQEELPTGSPVYVVGLIGPDTVEVASQPPVASV